jgi:membrane-associated protease RseP (regulator of RpoE activity)
METNWIGIILVFILVTIWHELGHIYAAKWHGIPIRRIGFGFGPTLWRSSALGETELVLRALPLGMSIGVPGRRDELGQLRRPIAHDIWMAISGPLASFLLPVLLFILLKTVSFDPSVQQWILGAGVLSALVGLLNLLPLPSLDGGHLLMLSMAHAGWQVSPLQEIRINKVSMQVIIAACLFSGVVQAWQWLAA